MATAAANLETAIANVAARIAEVTASSQPDYTVNGRTISMGTYLTQLQQTLAGLTEQRDKLRGPYMVVSRVRA